MATQDYYETYWSPGGTGYGLLHETYPELRQLLQASVSRTSSCLDVGCGDGRTCGLWLREHAGSYVGVDISRQAIEEARALGLDARVIEDAASLPFPDKSFDIAVCIEVLEHLFEPHAAAREILRVLRPGGVLIVTVPNVVYWTRRVDLVLGRWDPAGDHLSVQQPWRDPHLRFFDLGALKRMLEASGFCRVKVGGHHGVFLPDIPYARRVKGLILRTPLGGSPHVRRLIPKRRASSLYRRLERILPSLLAFRLHAVATKPLGG